MSVSGEGAIGQAFTWLRRVNLGGTSHLPWCADKDRNPSDALRDSPGGIRPALTIRYHVDEIWLAEEF